MIFPPFVELDALQRKTGETLAWTPSSVTQSHIFLYTHGLVVCNPALAVLAEFPWLWLPVVSPTNAEISQIGWITGHVCYIFQSLNSKSLVPLLTFFKSLWRKYDQELKKNEMWRRPLHSFQEWQHGPFVVTSSTAAAERHRRKSNWSSMYDVPLVDKEKSGTYSCHPAERFLENSSYAIDSFKHPRGTYWNSFIT